MEALDKRMTLAELIAAMYNFEGVTVRLDDNVGFNNVEFSFDNNYALSLGFGPGHYGSNRDYFDEYGHTAEDRARFINHAYSFEVALGYKREDRRGWDFVGQEVLGWADSVKGWVDVPELIDMIEAVRNL